MKSAVDAYGALGLGLYSMSAPVNARRLCTLSTLGGAVAIFARLLPVSPVSQAYMGALFVFWFAALSRVSSIPATAGAVFLGTSVRLALEYCLERVLTILGRFPANPGLLETLVWLSPCSLAVAVVAHLAVTRFHPFPPVFAVTKDKGATEDLTAESSSEHSMAARLLSVMVLIIAFSGSPAAGEAQSWLGASGAFTLPLFLFALILWASSRGTKPLWASTLVTPVDLLDLGLLPVLIHLVLQHTGGLHSPHRALHIPLVVTNSLKKGSNRGLISAVISLVSITILGLQAQESSGSWISDSNITMGLVYVLTFYVASRFGATEAALKQRLFERATTDDLTLLYNHGYVDDYLDKLLESDPDRTYLLMIDLDNFKTLNDSLGHVDGDRLLRSIADNLRRVVRGGDIVARYGGDEFMVIPRGVTSEDQVLALGERIRQSIEKTCKAFAAEQGLRHISSILTASCGIAYTTDEITDKESLIRAADEALYVAKAQGKNRAVITG
ncbi:MAG: diguanylate cyclase [Bacillota bacterium]